MCERQIDHNSIFFHVTYMLTHDSSWFGIFAQEQGNIGILLICEYISLILVDVVVYYSASVSSSNISLLTSVIFIISFSNCLSCVFVLETTTYTYYLLSV